MEEASKFAEDGFVTLQNLFPIETINQAQKKATENFDEVMKLIEDNNLPFGIGVKTGFKEIVQRHKMRYEMPYKMDDALFDFVLENQTLKQLLQEVLHTQDLKIANRSCILSVDGAGVQGWHVDGPHVSVIESLPCHVLNVFIPLVDIDESNGPTEFRPGSQKYTNKSMMKAMLLAKAKKDWRPAVTPSLKRGDVLLVSHSMPLTINILYFTCFFKFDYRVLHRGLANFSGKYRPVLVFTFSQPWYKVNLKYKISCYFLLPSFKIYRIA